ncbi:26S protease regulatory subunit 6B, putative [Entamoeba invadens IP1]|uniref:26S protease regulatory subunit 6B, putative n=1 Tax=Entamoeba invadens IP1 TaxID=370355 RepID=UPI0002C3F6AA|nr:26S protease regulatory subunit 6B, putative [Entamoeba invadens IP1]ELP90551.1 26S protease regulatory subunit 6B, putative [Entamoeba invadens IP1]|eukprot:XP_004257322.1 26S protease regulatory subunit 6B, putative [Entamoeba invadens IP1]
MSHRDYYLRLKSLQSDLDHLKMIDGYIHEEQQALRLELSRAQEEVKRVQSVPLHIGQFVEMVDKDTAVVTLSSGTTQNLSCAPQAIQRTCRCTPTRGRFCNSYMTKGEMPNVTYADIGGCDIQKQEIREAVELPLTQSELYKQIGIDPPRGCLLYGPPGTGKTMLAKAVAHHTSAAFIQIVGSEFAQQYLGEGPRMVRDVFRLARENAPSIVFIDEVDSIATKRHDAQNGADREVQRVLMELLTQMDGFDQTTNVKIIMATNRADSLDPALLRPGRLDRKIEFPLPDRRQKRLIFQVLTQKMNLSKEIDLEDFASRPDRISGAEIASICQEAGMHAVRKNRYIILPIDFDKAYKKVVRKQTQAMDFYR